MIFQHAERSADITLSNYLFCCCNTFKVRICHLEFVLALLVADLESFDRPFKLDTCKWQLKICMCKLKNVSFRNRSEIEEVHTTVHVKETTVKKLHTQNTQV